MLRRSLLMAGLLLLAGASAARSGTPVHLTLKAGPLSLAGEPLQVSGDSWARLVVTDARGSGAGWRLLGEGRGLKVVSVSVSCAQGSTCALPRSEGAYPRPLAASPRPLLEALPPSGRGRMVVEVELRGQGTASFSLRG